MVKDTPSDFFLSKKTQNRIENRLNYKKIIVMNSSREN